MSNPAAMLAIQFDRATVGLQASLMRDQIISNAESLFLPGQSEVPTSYTVAIAEHKHPHVELLQYTAALVRADGGGARIVLLSAKEMTIWGAYRSLMRETMRELGKKEEFQTRSRRRVPRMVVSTAAESGSDDGSPVSERSVASPTSSVSSADSDGRMVRVKKSLRVLGLSR